MSEQDIHLRKGEKHLYKAIKEVSINTIHSGLRLPTLCSSDDRRRPGGRMQGRRVKLWQAVNPVNVPGFVGSKNLGNKLAGEALFSTM